MTRAVRNVNEKISEALIGMDPTLQSQIDQVMIDLDKTEKKVIHLFFLMNWPLLVCIRQHLRWVFLFLFF